jgi:glycosyltransferase involved in cell wall biosynthesis
LPKTLSVIIPVYNDWDSVKILIGRITQALKAEDVQTRLLVVDDGSDTPAPAGLTENSGTVPVSVLRLKRNLGHQRAISVALAYLDDKVKPDFAAVIDGDGEDDPADLPRLLEAAAAFPGPGAAFAERSRRAEGLVFKTFYIAYRLLHLALTGSRVKFGNYSVVNSVALAALAVAQETWSHYAAAAVKLRIPIRTVPSARLKRISGGSKMNFFSLVSHGLSAMAVFGDIIGARALGALSALMVLVLALICAVLGIKFGTHLAIPGWATYSVGLLITTLLQLGMLAVVFAFLTLAGRQNSAFLPGRDYRFYVDSCSE